MSSTVLASSQLHTIGSPWLWAATIAGVLLLLVLDFAVTRRPHEVSMREALRWTSFYLALPVIFGAVIWATYGSRPGTEFFTGYLLEKSLSVDNLFVFMLLLAAFAVPARLAQRVLLFGIAGALVLRGIFIALGAAALASLDWAFLLFGAILLITAAKLLKDAITGQETEVEVSSLRAVRLLRRVMPVTDGYRDTRLSVREAGRRALTPLALVVTAVMTTDLVFAVDSVPAVYGVTGDPYLVFATNAFALLGLRALYFVLHAALNRLVHLAYGLALILAFIGVKLVLHWAHQIWASVPQIPTAASLLVIVVVLAAVTVTSLWVTRGENESDSTPKTSAQ
ncbi:TerC/Alx family metal homeostasis membrane protein [Nocardia sp. CA2R105]|uniref:TerC/Alx family metal homeostasis membrane protein n=1 Tax=Nocardia coffeae TaxID=2873381 RepID=UPI001CA770BE|nr:TerC/Alx family metal homeostasis membrane protein [Nocardia coffeae]MBY8858533.1 TerC/Alx family metal homeostasis membrane protein [Nocardia coffeae]